MFGKVVLFPNNKQMLLKISIYPFFRTLFVANLFIAIVVLLPGKMLAQNDCGCTNCPQFMPDGFTGEFLLNVQNASNPTLGQNGQGVCGVRLFFDHEYLGDLRITLTSPSGQTITLVGPIGLFGPTDFTTWDVTFLPCGDPVSPDPGFSSQWNNNQPWGLFGTYTGTYHPATGCLENFNTGPVNGTWTLTVVDGQAVDVGNFYDYDIIFCDPSGIDCFSCAAFAGVLPQPDVTACEGAASLNLNLPPSYTAQNPAPPSPEYSYIYVIAGPGGIIQAFEPTPDLSAYPPGAYTVCGLSYLTAQAGDIPTPNGSLTMTQLDQQLNSNTPPFCGDISNNCVNVTVLQIPENVEETVEICAPQCYFFYNQNYCQSGTYVRNLTQNGCPYTATLYLTVRQPNFTNLVETICEDGCSQNPGFPGACGPGVYQETFQNQFGCDSTVTLNLIQQNVVAVINNPPSITCSQPNPVISGIGSTTGPTVSYLWTASNGGNITGPLTSISTTINAPGDYQLRVCRAIGSILCCDSVSVTITANNSVPSPPTPISGPTTVCLNQDVNYSVPAVPGATSYTWTLPAGVTLISGQSTNSISVDWTAAAGGNICVVANNACGSSAPPSCINVVFTPAPVPVSPQGPDTVCTGNTAVYSVPSVANADSYFWSLSPNGVLLSGQGTNQITVDWGAGPSGSVCLSVGNVCDTSQNLCLNVQIDAPPPPSQPTGPVNVCVGDTTAYSIAAVPGASGYVWTTTGGTVISGGGTNTVQVAWNNIAGAGSVCVRAINPCGPGPDSCLAVSVFALPSPSQIITTCDSSNLSYTVNFTINGGAPPYAVNGIPVAGNTYQSAPILSGQPYSLVITNAIGCASQVISGAFNCSCSSASGQMSLQTLSACGQEQVSAQYLGGANLDGNDVAAYVLHSNSGTTLGTVFAQNATGVFGIQPGMNFGTSYYISYVVGNNLNGFPDPSDVCLSVSQGQPVVFYEQPVALAGSDAADCALTINLSASANVGAGSWSILGGPAGGLVVFGNAQNAQTSATANQYGAYNLLWQVNNNACTDADTVVLTFNSNPGVGSISEQCDGANENYTLSFPVSGGQPPYLANGTGFSGNTYNSGALASGTAYNVVISDANGCTAAAVTGSFTCNCSTNAGTMSLQTLSACAGDTISAIANGDYVLDANDTLVFVLHTGSGASLGTVLASNNSGIFTFTNGMTFGTTYYISTVAGTNLNGSPNPADPCLSVAAGQPVVFYDYPAANAGADQATCGNQLSLNGTGGGLWSQVSGPSGGNLVFGDVNSATSQVTASATGNYTALWTVSANGCTSVDQVSLQFNEIPVLGNLVRTCDPTNQFFTVSIDLTGGALPYSVNGTALGGAMYISPAFSNGQSYSFTITDANGCALPVITGAYSCNCATDAGAMASNTLSVCEGQTATAQSLNNYNLDGNDIIAFVLHSGSGAALGQVFSQNTSGVFSLQSGMSYGTTYYISLVAGNNLNGLPDPSDPCFSVSPGQPVIFIQTPVPDAGTDNAVCGDQYTLGAANGGLSGTWNQIGGSGTAAFANSGAGNSQVTVPQTGVYTFQWTVIDQGCPGSDTVAITFNEAPLVGVIDELCDPTNTSFQLSFSVSGGQPPYQSNGIGGIFTGSGYLSDPIANNATYIFTVIDANGCPSQVQSGSHNCNCSTDAGSMQITPAVFCAGQPASAIWNNDGLLDGNDTLVFVLHTASSGVLGNILAQNNQPVFDQGSLPTGVTYYISPVAGNLVNGSISLNDPCLSVSPGAPIQWKALPAATISADQTVCAGTTVTVQISGTGAYPLTVDYLVNGQAQTASIVNAQGVSLTNVPAAGTTIFSLQQVSDGTLPQCVSPLLDSTIITVNQAGSAGTPDLPLYICEGQDLPIQLVNMLQGADFGGQWVEISNTPSLPGAFNAATGSFQTGAQPAGTYRFQYTIQNPAPCPVSTAVVTVVLEPLPIADAGEDKTINCNQAAVAIGGISSSTGSGISYQWLYNGVPVGDNVPFFTGTPGTYVLVVDNQAGCSASDEVVITTDNEVPYAAGITIKDVRCYGDKDGRIVIDSIVTTHPPVLISFDGGVFGAQRDFYPLEPGPYQFTLRDANGCTWTSDTLWVKEPPQLMVELGADVEVILGDSLSLLAVLSTPMSGIDSIYWSPLLDTVHAGTPLQSFIPTQTRYVVVRVVDTNGCAVSDRILVIVNQLRRVFIPNIISPNSDNNGVLSVFGGPEVESVEVLRVYDRWGNEVYAAFNFPADGSVPGWDGRVNGDLAPAGVYVYFATVKFINGEKLVFKGDVTILR